MLGTTNDESAAAGRNARSNNRFVTVTKFGDPDDLDRLCRHWESLKGVGLARPRLGCKGQVRENKIVVRVRQDQRFDAVTCGEPVGEIPLVRGPIGTGRNRITRGMVGNLFDVAAATVDLDDNAGKRRRDERIDIDNAVRPRAHGEALFNLKTFRAHHHEATLKLFALAVRDDD